jgi:hypothetical protein
MNKNFLIPSLAALLITSTGHAADPVPYQAPPAVAILLDPVQYKDLNAAAKIPQINIAGYSPITDAMLVGGSKNPALAHQIAENSMIMAHNHFDLYGRPQVEGSPFEACRNYQIEQLAIALSQSGSPLKKYLKDYTKTYGGTVQLATSVQLNSWSPMTLSSQGLVSPELNIVEDPLEGAVGLNLTPVLEAETTFQSSTPKMSCKILSAEEISQIAGYQLADLKAKHLKKMKDSNGFKIKDLMSVVSSTLQTVPRFGYPASMDVQLEKVSSDGTIKFVSNTQGSQGVVQDSSPTVAASAN